MDIIVLWRSLLLYVPLLKKRCLVFSLVIPYKRKGKAYKRKVKVYRFRNVGICIQYMLRDKSNKRNRICLNLLAIFSKTGTVMAVPAVPVATALIMNSRN